MGQWEKNMEYLEDYGDAAADTEAMEAASAGAQGENDANEQIEKLDRAARKNGAKPADEWTRRDFAYLLRYHRQLLKLETDEIRALFLIPAGYIGGVWYFTRGNVRQLRRRRANGLKPLYELADAPMDVYFQVNAPEFASELSRDKENKKLDAIWENL